MRHIGLLCPAPASYASDHQPSASRPMRLIVERQRLELVASMQESARLLASRRWQEGAFRGVVDPGRRTKTQVQRAVHEQMATKRYGLVSAKTRGTPKRAELVFEIHGVTGGQRIEQYKGLQVLKSAGGQAETGSVQSGVWNAPEFFSARSQPRKASLPCCRAAAARWLRVSSGPAAPSLPAA